jgi:type I restriction enzyme S subunit
MSDLLQHASNSGGAEWETVPLGDVATFINGDRGQNYPSQSDYVARGIPFISAIALVDGRVDTAKCNLITEGAFNRLRNGKTKDGDLLFCLRGSLGKIAKVQGLERGAIASSLVIIRANERAEQQYLYYVLVGPIGQRLAGELNNGSVQPNISATSLQQSFIPLPPLSEQRAIAAVLGALDDKIELNRRMNETLEALAQSLFKSWFVDATANGLPKGWKLTQLKNLTTKIGSGATPRGGNAVYVDEGVALIRSQNVYDHEFHWNGLARLTDEAAKDLQGVEVKPEDILLNITGDSILRTCMVEPEVLPARVNQHVAIIRSKPGIPPRFLHLFLVQPRMKHFLAGLDAGATRRAITKGQLEAVELLLPPDEILVRFAEVTNPWFQKINSNRSESRTLAALRDALLPKLLSSELRVPNSKEHMEASL